MKNFRPIRIAVILSLIVATMIQPMVGVALASGCGDAGCHQKLVCEGCGCCEIENRGDKCCCCESHERVPANDDCGHPSDDQADQAVLSPSPIIKGVCLCGISAPPMNHSNDRERLVERAEPRECIVDAYLLNDHAPERYARRSDFYVDSQRRIDRFSQRLFCVWRI